MKKLLQLFSKMFLLNFSPNAHPLPLKGNQRVKKRKEVLPLGRQRVAMECKTFLMMVFSLTLLIGLTAELYAQDDEVCGMDADDAWGGDTAAMNKFLASCGRIDTVNLDEHNKPAKPKAKPHHQTIKMVLHSGKVLRTDSIFFVAETMPLFPGGETGLFKYLKKSVIYPALARQQKVQGRVYVEFIIERDGSVSHVKVTRGIGSGCNEEAARVVAQMPKWTSGKMKENPVRVQYTLPVNFTL